MISEAERELAWLHGGGLDSNHGCVSVAKSFNSGSDFRCCNPGGFCFGQFVFGCYRFQVTPRVYNQS